MRKALWELLAHFGAASGDLLCLARKSVVVCCEEALLGLDSWWGFFGGIFLWNFFRAFSAGKQPKKSQKKIRTPKSAQAITNSAKKSAPKNPHPKIRKKSVWKSTPTRLCKSPNQSMSEANSSKPVPEKAVNSLPHLRLICYACRQPRQFYTDHHILISRCWQRKIQEKSAQKVRYATLGQRQY